MGELVWPIKARGTGLASVHSTPVVPDTRALPEQPPCSACRVLGERPLHLPLDTHPLVPPQTRTHSPWVARRYVRPRHFVCMSPPRVSFASPFLASTPTLTSLTDRCLPALGMRRSMVLPLYRPLPFHLTHMPASADTGWLRARPCGRRHRHPLRATGAAIEPRRGVALPCEPRRQRREVPKGGEPRCTRTGGCQGGGGRPHARQSRRTNCPWEPESVAAPRDRRA